jgi:hypothetical protein
MHDYIMNITLAKGSGEYCICRYMHGCLLSFSDVIALAHILAPGAHARMPLVDRIAALNIPITFVCAYYVFILCLFLIAIVQTVIRIGWTPRAVESP